MQELLAILANIPFSNICDDDISHAIFTAIKQAKAHGLYDEDRYRELFTKYNKPHSLAIVEQASIDAKVKRIKELEDTIAGIQEDRRIERDEAERNINALRGYSNALEECVEGTNL